MTDLEQKKKAKEFAERWKGKGYEKGESQKFWIDLLENVLGVSNAIDFIHFEDTVHIDKATGFIDGFIDKTKVLIEQKSIDKDLRKAIKQSDGSLLNPFQQAKRYSSELSYDNRPRWIVTCNFKSFLVYDMNNPNGEPEEILLKDLGKEYYRLSFIVDAKSEHLKKEEELSFKAGELVGVLYDAFSDQYNDLSNEESQKSLNELCVRLVFCLYAEDAGLFGRKNVFHDYLTKYEDLDLMRKALIELFKVLDQPLDKRDPYLEDDLNQFPYVNGGLFSNENIEIPRFTEKIRNTLLSKASDDFDWSEISPTIFGAVFESTLNPETRRSGGMHYTSIENIHKVIDPLFLNDLREELNDALAYKNEKTRNEALDKFQEHIGSLTFLDPACGSGNFLTETYLSLRRLENEAIASKQKGMMALDLGDVVKVSINQFYGIEINDFAVKVATTALWIAESQMLQETSKLLSKELDFLPLKNYTNIYEGNALRVNWNEVVPNTKCNYIMGNPPFVGSSIKSKEILQKEDKQIVFGEDKAGKLDYVACWYKKANDYINKTRIQVAFVSTNSVTQGEQVKPLWENILNNTYINFAYRTFRWDSEASLKAHVHCVIIGFSKIEKEEKLLYDNGIVKKVKHINGYLIGYKDFYIESRTQNPVGLPKLTQGNKPWDDGGLILSAEEKEYLNQKYPILKKYIKKYVGAKEFINKIDRYCLWFVGGNPSEYRNIQEIKSRLETVVKKRLESPTEIVREQANTPMLFSQIRQPKKNYILIPETSSSSRKYIPMGFMDKDIIVSNSVMTAETDDVYLFGILESNVHMAWVKTLCGRLKSDFRYSPTLYNSFPWPNPTKDQKEKIEKTAQAILDARSKYPNSSLADLYDELTMPSDLRKAHQLNDVAVMEAYGFNWRKMTESDCVAELMKMYQSLTEKNK